MKSEVKKPEIKSKPNKYPALYEAENGDVILVIEDGATTLVGTIIKSNSVWSIGYYSADWLKSKCKRMEPGTTVTLTQP